MHERQENIYGRCRGTHCYKLTVESLESSFPPNPHTPSFSRPVTSFDQFPSQADSSLLAPPNPTQPNLHGFLSPCYSRSPCRSLFPQTQDIRTLSPPSRLPFQTCTDSLMPPSRLVDMCANMWAGVSESSTPVCEMPSTKRMPDNVDYVTLARAQQLLQHTPIG